jgi:cystathionine beta-lyase
VLQIAYLAQNRDYLASEITERFPKARATVTEGTFLQWVDLTEYSLGNAEKYLRDTAKVALSGGEDFAGGEGFVRINFATQRSLIQDALNRIEKTLN